VLGYLEALDRFGLQELKQGDVQIKDGNIAVTADGDWQFGNTRVNALFRLVERWRLNQPTLDELYASMLTTSQRLKDLLKARADGIGASLVGNPVEFHEENESIGDYESGSSVFAGAILVVLNNLLQRCKRDFGASDTQWDSADPKIYGYSIGVVFAAAAANFRHHDEWARLRNLDDRPRASMEPLCAVLGRNLLTQGYPTIRTNVCREVLIAISGDSVDRLYKLTFDYAKALAA
jgi:hypothetical protein